MIHRQTNSRSVDLWTVQLADWSLEIFKTLLLTSARKVQSVSLVANWPVCKLNDYELVGTLTGQFTDKPIRDHSSLRLVNSRTSQLADSEIFLNHGITTLYWYIKPSPNPNPVEYRQCTNNAIYPKSHLLR